MKITLNVTKTGIQKGERHSREYCPLARAARAAGFKYVSVGPFGIAGDKGDKSYFAYYTKGADKFVNNFDRGRIVKPQSFTFNFKPSNDREISFLNV